MSNQAHLTSLVRKLIGAENAGSRRDADQILSSAFLGITRADGSEQDREALLQAIEAAQGRGRVREMEEPVQVSLGSETALVRGIVAVRAEADQKAIISRFRNTLTFRLEGSDWRCIGWQVTRLAVPRLASKMLPVARDAVAPDKSDVRVLLELDAGGMAHFELPPGQTSRAVSHKTVSEIWYILRGRGEMWRKFEGAEEVIPLQAGLCLTLPLGTHFQFRSFGYEALSALGLTMPRWPGEGEAFEVKGRWDPTL